MVSRSRTWLYLIAAVWVATALAVPSLVRAGGWAVITLDETPGEMVAGKLYQLGFTVRQHGRTPWEVDEIIITARQPKSGQEMTFTAVPEGAPGHYQAGLMFPTTGLWEWNIHSGLYPDAQPMPPLKVISGEAAGISGSTGASTGGLASGLRSPSAWLAAAALLALVVGGTLVVRGRARGISALAGLGLLVVCGGLAFAFFTSVSAESKQVRPKTTEQPGAELQQDAESGRQVFLAKGCVVCHINNRAIKGAESYSVDAGPNLTAYHNDAGYLRKFLANPVEMKPDTEMPNLGLSEAEIEALVIFINAE